ncbi:uncharacterized protein NECHADRAFT_81245 [Fusarium vanettenii 77-13-4]|uniref:BTB domain-containing protein n=1 Tax=Fusarium vanettenii (strain ATCC MYA-4622 / CBS 123669 / FGSC 9596 / NRRL 45880 / 77-13-4) TaxID=660122 RepID=C7ZHH5_FUSV7|nr:uncharacterized protein NECHADRAFT_81245 [Fusarium vanettenii 77-13-4]EEU36468.1 hypothetical protein NECHADRAFT_81245 [Fusarium vanettenii 77-13-4]
MGSKSARKHAAQKQDDQSSGEIILFWVGTTSTDNLLDPTEAGLRQLIPDGDIILLVGPKQEKIQISSHLLCLTSPVFKAMLNVLYGADPSMKLFTPAQIQDIAILADKYQMVDRFSFAEAFWLKPPPVDKRIDFEATWRLMTAAYFLKSHRRLVQLSNVFVTHRQVSLVKFASQMSNWTLGLKLSLAIEEYRSRHMNTVGICLHCFEQVEKTGLGFVDKSPKCPDPTHAPTK